MEQLSEMYVVVIDLNRISTAWKARLSKFFRPNNFWFIGMQSLFIDLKKIPTLLINKKNDANLLFIILFYFFIHIVSVFLAYIQFFRWYTPSVRANIVVSHIRTPDDRAIHSSATRITIHRRLPGDVGAINMKRVAYTRYLIRVMWRRDAISVHSRRAWRGKSVARVGASLTRAKIHSPWYRIQLYM